MGGATRRTAAGQPAEADGAGGTQCHAAGRQLDEGASVEAAPGFVVHVWPPVALLMNHRVDGIDVSLVAHGTVAPLKSSTLAVFGKSIPTRPPPVKPAVRPPI